MLEMKLSHLIRQMGYLALATPTPEESAQDLSNILGLRIVDRSDGVITLSSNERLVEIGYIKSDKAALLALGLEAVDADAVDEARCRAIAAGCEILSDASSFTGARKAVRFRTPYGPIFEVHSATLRHVSEGNGVRPRARRLEHANLQVEDAKGLSDLCASVFGMQVSDRTTNDEIIWLRCYDGFHHTLAIAQGVPKLRHFAFDLHRLEDIVAVADTLSGQRRRLAWGPGRHGAGNNIFAYYIDPNGCAIEASVGMARIDNEAAHQPGIWSLTQPNLRNQWGGEPGPDYAAGGLPLAAKP
jgi:catechol-2,3-dioxygenase